jgi:Uma2 family endonuclease
MNFLKMEFATQPSEEGRQLMNEILDFDTKQTNEAKIMPSINHSFLQARIAGLFLDHEKFTPFIELSLDASQIDLSQFGLKNKELVPDVCLYEEQHQFDPFGDATKRTDMPQLVIEILSPSQGTDDIITKLKAYFALGVKSCWLIVPANQAITIYSGPGQFETYGTKDTEIRDETLQIQLPTAKIFGPRKRSKLMEVTLSK